MKFILGKKIGMSQIFKENKAIPVTVLQVEPCKVTGIKTKAKNDYGAVQIGCSKISPKKLTKPEREWLKDIGYFKYIMEFRTDHPEEYKKGQEIDVSIFSVGEKVKVSGITLGKGFTGVMKRWGFKGSPKTHGTKHTLKAPGSIGATWPQRVIKGMKMAGRAGGRRVTIRNLEIVELNKDKNMLVVKGAVPGPKKGLIQIRSEK